MLISGVSLTLTWPPWLCLFRVLLGVSAFPFPSSLGAVTLYLLSQASVFIYSSCGKWAFPLSCGVFLPLPLLQAFLFLVAGWVPLLLPSLVGLVIHSSVGDCPSPPSVVRAPHPLCYMSFLLLLLIIQFYSFFPGWGSVCTGGYADLAQGCLWEYCVLLSSHCGLRLPKQSGHWHLAVVWEPSWFLHLT
jgi:hypothetical protein